MKTLYEILEVSETASKEIIEKTYRVLAKKYHPDLQPESEKAKAEQIMKEINEAYNTLSNETLRKAYDEELKQKRELEKQQNSSYYNTNPNNNYQTNNYGATNQNNYQDQNAEIKYRNMQEEMLRRQEQMEREMQNQYAQKYQQAYEGYLRSLGYKIKYKWTWKNYRDFLIAVLTVIIVFAIIWIFPPTHKMLMDLYESNSILKAIIDVIGKILLGIWNAICSLFVKRQ